VTDLVDIPTSTRTVLIVDDDPSVRETFQRMLQLEGYAVLTAVNADIGLIKAHDGRPDAIILDLRMPLVNGVQFLRSLRSRPDHAHTPVAIVTGDYFFDDKISADLRSLGAELRFKPMWLEELVKLARHLLEPTAS
jgi:DNA-binding response OmpR family regulator